MTLDLRVHHWKRDKRNRAVLTKTRPYIRLRNGDSPAVFIQEGRYYTDNGEEMKKIPSWVADHLKGVSDIVKREVGLAVNSPNDPA